MALGSEKIRLGLMPVLGWLAAVTLVAGLAYGSAQILDGANWLMMLLGGVVIALLGVGLILAWADRSIRAVTRQTLAQCFRMKLAVAFLVLLILVLTILPFVVRGDETLAGRIRTFLVYSMMAITWLLTLLTVLSTLMLISSDVESRTAWMILSKPLGRAEYLIGRFMGVLTMNAILLAVAGGIVLVAVQTMRHSPAVDHSDRQAVETEIFTARVEVSPVMPDYAALVEAQINKLKENGTYDDILGDFENFGARLGDTPQERLQTQLTMNIRQRFEIVPPMAALGWKFENISLSGSQYTEMGDVQSTKPETPAGRKGQHLRVQINIPESLAGRLQDSGPIKVNDVQAEVAALTLKTVDVRFSPATMSLPAVKELKPGRRTSVTAMPVLQFRYKARAIREGGSSPGETLYRQLAIFSGNQPMLVMGGRAPLDAMSTANIPAIKELREGDVGVVYRNVPMSRNAAAPPPVSIPFKNVTLMYRVGDFEMNYVRALLLILARLAFLAALGTFLGSFLSFPVGAMTALVLLIGGALLDWMISQGTPPKLSGDVMTIISGLTGHILQMLLPSLSEVSPGDNLVDGLLLPWRRVTQATVLAVASRGLFYLALGCIIFRRRELAKVQV